MTSGEPCKRCGGSGRDPEHEGRCGECLERYLDEANEGNDVIARLLALADFYEERACAPSLPEYSEVDGLRRAAEIVKEPIRHLNEEIDKWYVKARVYGAIAYQFSETLKAILGTVDDSSHTSRGLAREALNWRHSEQNGVPMSAIEEMDMLLGAKIVIEELKKRIENGMAAHREEKTARDWLAREKERLEMVIRTGGAMYRAERAAMGIPGGIDPTER